MLQLRKIWTLYKGVLCQENSGRKCTFSGGRLLKMVATPSRHVFDEDLYVQYMYISFCFKNVLGRVERLFKSRLFVG